MADMHNQIFFGQSTGISIQTTSKKDPFIFIKCIKKKADGSWEKPSLGEGKTIKCNLEEIIMMLQVLEAKTESWSNYHEFNKKSTQISFKWEEGDEKKLWINIDKYSKMLNFPQIEILRLLMKHILKEKIKYATTSNINEETDSSTKTRLNQEDKTLKEKGTQYKKFEKNKSKIIETSQIDGSIQAETKNAMLINFKDENEIWVPKSIIRSSNTSEKELVQTFLIDTWFLKKHNLELV
jgi:hypothetical protein